MVKVAGQIGRLTRTVAFAAIVCALVLKTLAFAPSPYAVRSMFGASAAVSVFVPADDCKSGGGAPNGARSTIAGIACSAFPAVPGRKPIASFCPPRKSRSRRRATARPGAAATPAFPRAPLPVAPGGLGRRPRPRELEPSG